MHGLPAVDPPSPLMFACLQGDAESVRMLLLSGEDPNEIDEQRQGQTPLHAAVRSPSTPTALVQVLLGARADANMGDDQGRTALHHAVSLRRADLFAALLNAGANRNATSKASGREPGQTPTQLIVK